VNKETTKEMRKILKEIQDGSFARVWIRENKTGRRKYDALMKKDLAHPIEKVGRELRGRMPWLNQA
jgi:ketol-acid reductoisomerase